MSVELPEPPSVPGPADLSTLLERLQSLGPDATLADAEALLRPPLSPGLERARRLAALVRTLDADVYARLIRDEPDKPALDAVVSAYRADFVPGPAGTWALRDDVREALLADWMRKEAELRAWNEQLFEYYRHRDGEAAEIEALYHSAGSITPKDALEFVDERYTAADDRADFAHCHALLEALRVQDKLRGHQVSVAYRDKARYLHSRLLFLEALQKTRNYVERAEPHALLETVLNRTTAKPWIFHIHATGGYGKTMLLRWFLSQDLVLQRVPCAAVDFDDPKLLTSLQYPLRLLSVIIRQWSQQMTQTALLSAVTVLDAAANKPGWDDATMATLRGQLEGANIQEPMIAVLDTLEERSLFQPEWVRGCVETLRELHKYLPRLTVVLAGRYDLSKIPGLFEDGEVEFCDLPPFTNEESVAYLASRGIADGPMQQAIVERAEIGDRSDDGQAVPAPSGLNPFKLSALADLVLDDPDLTPDDVQKLPSVDVAYLIERVIVRIPSQPLRWVVRYGAIARGLTLDFVEGVLLPPLKEALNGASSDLSKAHLTEKMRQYLDSKVTWTAQPGIAGGLTAQGLWNELKAYARDRGWISSDPQQEVLHLHPEVIKPVQTLLRDEPVYRTLHAAARDFYLERWTNRAAAPAGAAAAAAEAIYHATAIGADEGYRLWRRLITEADGDSRYAIASEPTRSSYLDEQRRPRFPAWFCEAHHVSATFTMLAAGVNFSPFVASNTTFLAHVTAAVREDAAAVPPLLTVIAQSEGPGITTAQTGAALDRALTSFTEPRDQLWLLIRAAHVATARGDDVGAEAHWRSAAEAAERAGVREVTRTHVERPLADLLARVGSYGEAMTLYERVRGAGISPLDTLHRETRLALTHRDLERAGRLVDEGLHDPASRTLELAHRVAAGDVRRFFEGLNPDWEQMPGGTDEDRTTLYVLNGQARRLVMDFHEALEMFSRATDTGESIDSALLLEPIGVPEVELLAFDVGDTAAARRGLERWEHVTVTDGPWRSASPPVSRAFADDRFHFVRAYIDAREKNGQAAADLAVRESPLTRARAALLGLAFDLAEPPVGYLDTLTSAIEDLAPQALVGAVFELLQYLPAHSKSLAAGYGRIRDAVRAKLAGRARPPVETPLHLLELAIICNVNERERAACEAAAIRGLPADPSVPRLRYGLRLIEAAGPWESPLALSYQALLEECGKAGAAGTPLEALLKSRAALERARAHDVAGATALASEGWAVWRDQPEGRFRAEVQADHARVRSLAAPAAEAAASPAAAVPRPQPPRVPVMAADRGESAAAAPALRGLTSVVLDDRTATAFKLTLDKLDASALTLRLFNDWRGVRQLMTDTIHGLSAGAPGEALRIDMPAALAALPWEFVVSALDARLFCRGREVPPAPPLPPAGPESTPVFLIKPRGGWDYLSIASEAASGFSLEHLYSEGRSPRYVSTVESPHPDRLQAALDQARPQIVHIVGQVVDSPAGLYLDFEGAERRMLGETPQLGSRLDSSRLIRYFASRELRPVVILDITAPENITDVVHMLLLRNRFAAELHQSGAVRAVLATGFGGADERESLARALVGGIHDNTSLAFLWSSTRSDDEPDELIDLLSHSSSALFADEPYARVFARAPWHGFESSR